MKHIFKITFFATFLFMATTQLQAQPPHPNSGGAPTTGSNTRVGDAPANGAPVGNGTIILFMLAAAYAGRKVYQLHHTVETL
jgi:hypothetical protein